MSFTNQDVFELVEQNGKKLTPQECKRLFSYLDLLVQWNKKMNLVGPFSWERILTELIADSWHLADFLGGLFLPANPRSFDLGAGAGLPGIPLRLFWESGEYYLVEPREKRSVFMRRALRELELLRTTVLQSGYEQIPPHLLPADIVLSRAFCPWKEFLEIAFSLLKKGGRAIVLASEAKPVGYDDLVWQFEAAYLYRVRKKEQAFWSFVRIQ